MRGLLNAGRGRRPPDEARAVARGGRAGELEVEAIRDRAQPGDMFLLCRDGLHGVLGEQAIVRDARRTRTRPPPNALVGETLERGAPDNVTVMIVELHETTLLSARRSARMSDEP